MSKPVNIAYECPCCGRRVLGTERLYEVCHICGWEDDPIQFADPSFKVGANNESLDQCRLTWLTKTSKNVPS